MTIIEYRGGDVITYYSRKPIRICRSLHFCQICANDIKHGEKYHDGGYHKRAHVDCINHLRIGKASKMLAEELTGAQGD